MFSAFFRLAGIDETQFRVLLRTSLRIDLRTGFASGTMQNKQSSIGMQIFGLLMYYGFLGFFAAWFIVFNNDSFVSGTFICTMVMMFISMSVLIEFQSTMFSPNDYLILGYRPVDSRTFFAARVANALVHLGVSTGILCVFPVLAFTFAHGFNPVLGLAAAFAFMIEALTISLAGIMVYATALHFVLPAKLRSVVSYMQFFLSFAIYGVGFSFSTVMNPKTLVGFHLDPQYWMLTYPPAWFAGFISLADGKAPLFSLIAAALALVSFALLFMYARGTIALNYTDHLSTLAFATEKGQAAKFRKRLGAIPFFKKNEARAVALLIRNQFKYDHTFRMGVIAIIPLTVIYFIAGLKSGTGILDPFVNAEQHMEQMRLVYMAIGFFPIMLLMAMTRSESHQAAWIFYSSPADKGKLVLAMKNGIILLFMLPYLMCIAIVCAFYFTSPMHLVIHMLFLFLFSHLVLQLVILIWPNLPFSLPTKKGEKMIKTLGAFMIAAVMASAVIPVVVIIVYPMPLLLAAVFAAFLLLAFLLEYLLQKRVRRKADLLEFTV